MPNTSGTGTGVQNQATIIRGAVTVKEPASFSFDPKLWTKWRRRFERYMVTSGMKHTQSEEERVDSLVYIMGEDAEEIFQSFSLSAADKKSFDKVMEAFDNHFISKVNVIFERAKFNLRCQNEDESVEEFITSLYTLSEKCSYGAMRDELIRDRLVVGVRNKKLSENLQLESNLDLPKAVNIARNHSNVKKQQKELNLQERSQEVSYINKQAKPQRKAKPSTSSKIMSCEKCGRNTCFSLTNTNKACPAEKSKCDSCGRFGHYRYVCTKNEKRDKRVHAIEQEEGDSSSEEVAFLGMVKTRGEEDKRWTAEIYVNKRKITFLLDTGAPVNVIPLDLFDKLFSRKMLKSSDRKLSGPSGERLEIKGMCVVKFKYGREKYEDNLYVIAKARSPLLSLRLCEGLRIIQRINHCEDSRTSTVIIEKEFPKLFGKLGSLNCEYEIKLKPGSKPFAIYSARRVSIPLHKKLQIKLKEMVELDVIEAVDAPTEWCAPLVIVTKPDGDIRPCVDLSKLNLCIEREIHPMPVTDYTLAQLGGAKFFTKLDTKSGFWQIKLSKNSQKLTTFLTPFGRYCFKRLPFGISSAPEFFQKQMQRILDGVPGCVCHVDDILIYGRNMLEHDVNVRKVLQRLSKAGFTLNREKCNVGKTAVSFLGHYIDENGIHPGDSKIKALEDFPVPESVSSLRQFLGMVNYLGKYVPNLSLESQPLNELLKKNRIFQWGPDQQQSFDKLKNIISTKPVLKVYNPRHKTIVSSDASSYGLGAVLRQCDEKGKWRPVAYASRTLTNSEKNYAQIEKEGLGITWAVCEKFRDYVMGMEFEIETDHKPLLSIFTTKNLDDLTPRLQKFRLRLMGFQYKMQYTPGKDLVVADALSRSPQQGDYQEQDEELSTFVYNITRKLPATSSRIELIRKAQQEDEILQEVERYTQEGWSSRKKISREMKPYWENRYSFAVNDDLLMYGSRIVIPNCLRTDTLERIHKGHLGLPKCRQRMLRSVWWPSCAKDLESYVERCVPCIKERTPKREPMMPTTNPERPWHTIGADLCYCKGKNYLIVVDYFSKYPEVAFLENQTSKCVCEKLEAIFARHGKPNVVRSDNGPQFKSPHFRQLSKDWEFIHITSSPHYPQSNGQAEAMVKAVKALMKKNENLEQALLEYRTTPLANGLSPAELLMGRTLRGAVPIPVSQLKPKDQKIRSAINKEKIIKAKQTSSYNRRHATKETPSFKIGDVVWIRDIKVWGRIKNLTDEPRSYIVSTVKGDYRRNSYHLNNGHRTTIPEESSDEDDYWPKSVEAESNTRGGSSPAEVGTSNETNSSAEAVTFYDTQDDGSNADAEVFNDGLIPLEASTSVLETSKDADSSDPADPTQQPNSKKVYRTSSGREVKEPRKFKGFQLFWN